MSGKPLHVVMTADPYIPVPPLHYGGIERVIDVHVRELARRGHRVTLIAHPESRIDARLIPYGRPPHTGRIDRAVEVGQVAQALWRLRREADVVHSFGRLMAMLPILPLRNLPKVQTYQRRIPWTSVRHATRLAGRSLVFTGLAGWMERTRPCGLEGAGECRTIFNSVDTSRYTLVETVASDAPLMFLGRLERIKGTHNAIAIARGAGRRLVIAGNRVNEGPDAGYFDTEIAPHIDGHQIQYIGPVDDTQKNAWLGRAAALLMPIEWEEPFGIVMVEACACGTPVIAFNRGSVPDVIRPGVNGFACDGVDDAVRAVGALGSIDRRAVRADCEARFSGDVIAKEYESLYRELIARTRPDAVRRRAA